MEEPEATGSVCGDAAAAVAASEMTEILVPGPQPLRLLEWKVATGAAVKIGSVLAVCAPIQVPARPGESPIEPGSQRAGERKVKAERPGIVRELRAQPGQVIPPGGVLLRLEACSHPVVMKGLCAECGQDLTQLQSKNGKQNMPVSTATVSMVHSVPELMVSSEQAEQLGREDQERLRRNRKLVLMVDLDQTLIHTTEQHCPQMSNRGIFHYQLGRGEPMLHTRLRPHCKEFLEKIAKLYELHVFTFGSRLYAHTIAAFLDSEKKLFSHRILSRDECIDPYSKTGNLRNLFPCGDSMVCIIDDREDVWKFAPNLITVKKYVYFQGIGDINAPPGSREAQMRKKANHSSKLMDASDPAAVIKDSEEIKNIGNVEEQSNGIKKSTKEVNGDNSVNKKTREHYHAIALGAKITKTLELNEDDPNKPTHLIAARAGTEKVRQAQNCKNLHIVNPDWLWCCLERWDKVEEQLFPLKEDYFKTQRENSPAMFPDIPSAFQTALFHPTPIHPKCQPGPEVRLYDPNTGKLIRKGSPHSNQSPYIQAPAPPLTLPVHGEHSLFRAVQPHQQLFDEEEIPASETEEPGPSRRKRQPSMSETMPLYTLCKEDLESMDKEVDDILGEGSDDSDSEKKKTEEEKQEPHSTTNETLNLKIEERPVSTSSSERSLTGSIPRGHKRKLADDDVASESSKGSSNEDEEGSSSEADEMAAALEAELNDFM
ncbi:RNA polymerase II subunit A C-terminal domain phosphatase [Crotalus adamanteus]|uniref:RNA polymerase II subunit A C-terminal domain phosphatase n=1 Tax=Crotalus adamanteus TaxID=8729 RepID=A0AAW1BN33_CROAD